MRSRGHLVLLGPNDAPPAPTIQSDEVDYLAEVERHIAAAEQALAMWRGWLTERRGELTGS